MAITTQLLLLAQLAVAAPDTTPLAALVRVVDSVIVSDAPHARGGKIHLDVADFARKAGVDPARSGRLPASWQASSEAELTTCLASRECSGPTSAIVRAGPVKREPDGGLVIVGTLLNRSPSRMTATGAEMPTGSAIRQFIARLKLENGGWKVVSLSVARTN